MSSLTWSRLLRVLYAVKTIIILIVIIIMLLALSRSVLRCLRFPMQGLGESKITFDSVITGQSITIFFPYAKLYILAFTILEGKTTTAHYFGDIVSRKRKNTP